MIIVDTRLVCVRVCDAEMWTGGAYSSYYFKGPREDQVLGFDAITHDDVSVYLIFIY